jgi:hypothetical protein
VLPSQNNLHLEIRETSSRVGILLTNKSPPYCGQNLFETSLNKLLPIIEENNVMPNHPFGFRGRHSTKEKTHRIVHQINETLKNKQEFIDITQAFDTVRHTWLLYKLRLSLPLDYFIILKS